MGKDKGSKALEDAMKGRRVRPATVDSVIIKQGKVLLAKRLTPPCLGAWVLPGGFIEWNETAEQAAVRETKEETGISIKIEGLIGVYSKSTRDYRCTVSVAFLASVKGGRTKPQRNETGEIR